MTGARAGGSTGEVAMRCAMARAPATAMHKAAPRVLGVWISLLKAS